MFFAGMKSRDHFRWGEKEEAILWYLMEDQSKEEAENFFKENKEVLVGQLPNWENWEDMTAAISSLRR